MSERIIRIFDGEGSSSGSAMNAVIGFDEAVLSEASYTLSANPGDAQVAQLGLNVTEAAMRANAEGRIQPPFNKEQLQVLRLTHARYVGLRTLVLAPR